MAKAGSGTADIQACRERGRRSVAAGDWPAALAAADQGLRAQAGDAELLFYRGLALRRMGRNHEALAAYEAALAAAPDHPDLLGNYGNSLKDAGRIDEALACYQRALQVAPGLAWLHVNQANLLADSGDYRSALTAYQEGLRLAPDRVDGWCGLGRVLLELNRAEESLESYSRALAIDPDNTGALAGQGHALLELDQLKPALQSLARAVDIAPDDPDLRNGLAMAVQRSGDLSRAETLFSQALQQDGEFAEARYNRALLRLSMRQFSLAWADYEQRIGLPSFREHLRTDPASIAAFSRMPRWSRASASGGTLGVWAEQGLGDQVLFSMLLPELLKRDLPLVFELDRRLLPAYRRVFPDTRFVALAVPPDPALLGADQAIFCGSLPGQLCPEIKPAEPWSAVLSADAGRVAHYAARMSRQPRIAISWRSARAGWVGRGKSAELGALAALLKVPGVQWVDIQYGDTAGERAALKAQHGVELLHFDDVDYRNDLDDVLAIIEACDLVIATSNATAHLAGAMAKPVWLLHPGRPPFHYWVPDVDGRSHWYPRVDIVAADSGQDWSAFSSKLADRLRVWLERPGLASPA